MEKCIWPMLIPTHQSCLLREAFFRALMWLNVIWSIIVTYTKFCIIQSIIWNLALCFYRSISIFEHWFQCLGQTLSACPRSTLAPTSATLWVKHWVHVLFLSQLLHLWVQLSQLSWPTNQSQWSICAPLYSSSIPTLLNFPRLTPTKTNKCQLPYIFFLVNPVNVHLHYSPYLPWKQMPPTNQSTIVLFIFLTLISLGRRLATAHGT